jgi:hypothetical protein
MAGKARSGRRLRRPLGQGNRMNAIINGFATPSSVSGERSVIISFYLFWHISA